ncbi:hypothetical protein C6P40_004050, partial [Pichia californica]
MSDTFENYRQALQDSYELSEIVLDKLLNIKESNDDDDNNNNNNKINNNVNEIEKFNELNDLKSKLIFDSMKLIKTKNLFKNEFFKINEENIQKVKNGDSSSSNSFLLKLDIQTFKNNKQWNILNESISKLPDLQIKDLININNKETEKNENENDGDITMKEFNSKNEFIKSLDISLDDIKKLLWNDMKLDDNNKDKYFIPNESNNKLQKFLEESDIEKFRLVQLHDGYYQKKINLMKEMDRKWSFEINKIKNFISTDINKMKIELNQELNKFNKEDDEKSKEFERDGLDLNHDVDGIDYEVEEGEEGEYDDVEDE